MSVDYKVEKIYEEQIAKVAKTKENWQGICRLIGQLYRYEFDNILMVNAQHPRATLIADYDTWKKVGRFVKRGSKGIAIFPSRALQPHMRYVFDITDTGGKNQKLTWDLEGDVLKNYLDYLVSEGQMQQYEGTDKKELQTALKQFTGTNVWGIIRTDFEERASELSQLTGSVIMDFNEKRKSLPQDVTDMEQLIYKSVMYAVGTRCGFDLSGEEQDFGQIVKYSDEEIIYRLGTLVSDVSCNVLREFSKNLKMMEQQRRTADERSMTYGRSSITVQGSRRTIVSTDSDATGGRSETDQSGQVRNHGDELPERERKEPLQHSLPIREAGREDEGSGGRSESSSGSVDGGLPESPQATESGLHNGDVAAQGASKDAGRGDRTPRGSDEVPLGNEKSGTENTTSQDNDEELNRELEDLNSFGKSEEAGYYEQASFFDEKNPGKIKSQYTYLEPKKELVVPHEYVVEVLKKGSGTFGGEKRIYDLYHDVMDAGERARQIKKEYGLGGVGWPLEGYGLHGYDSFKPQGLRFQWRDEEGEKEGYLSWKAVEQEIGVLILTGEYYQPPEETLDDLEEKEQFDEYAIPDEPESYHSIERNAEAAKETAKPMEEEPAQKHNFHYDMWELPKGGAKTRYKWNVEAIQLLKKLESENRLATTEEQKTLSCYVGWGGLSAAFDENNQNWNSEYAELKELLTNEEYTAARATVNNAFYTSPEIARCMHQALLQFGFRKGNILEPSMGVGNFFGSIPAPMQDSRLYGVEVDSISGRIAGQLYQKANISITGFEKTTFPDNFFDVVIGNVPFGDYKLYDPKYNKHNLRIHDYFIAKAIDQVRPGGMVAVITTKGTLDKSNASFRKMIAQQAELVGAIRLPNTAFKENAGTEVTSDILFLQKRERKIDIEPDWVHLGYTENGIAVNSYFVEHPNMMLGHMEYDTRMFGENSRYTVCVNDDENFSLPTALGEAVQFITAQMTDFEKLEEEAEVSEDILPADPDVRNFSYTFYEGKLYYRENSQMYRKEVSKTVEDRIRFLDEIRSATRHLIDIQTAGCSEQELSEGQKVLNEKYDTFTAKYGHIVDKGNRMAFRDDSDYPLLCSLENVDAEGNVSKADMFHKQTIKPKIVLERVETAVEALNVSINEYGEVNIPYMLSLYQPDISSAVEAVEQADGETITLSDNARKELERAVMLEELAGVVYLNPSRYNEQDENAGWETADEYLSGNVRDKLRVARAAATEYPELFSVNMQALEKVQPVDIEASDIDVRIGTTWIEPQDYEQFIYELLKTPQRARAIRNEWQSSGIQVHLNKLNMQWFIENKSLDKHSVAATKTYGTSREDAYSIFEDTLNLKTVTIRDRIDDGEGKYHYEVNKNETMLAREKQNQIKAVFKEWLFREPERRQKYVQYYNETFNNIRLREYDGSYLQFPGMNPEITLDTHQKNAVARILLGGNTLLAHCVGAGKSFEMAAACMELKRLRIANKTILVVPKAVIEQTASEFLRLYPSANVLMATARDFEKSRRKQFVSRIATGDYDGIIMSHSQFEKIPISPERRERMLKQQIEEISNAIDDIKARNGERWTVKQMEAEKKKLEEQIKRLADESHKDDLVYFEELGVDCIMVDEAHSFKNLAIFSKMNNVSGISSSGAKKSTDMLLKCNYLSEINDGRGVVFATGTPISNTMCELYVMQLYLQKEALEQMGIYHFDSWAANFGEVTTALELTVEGSGFRFKSRFNKFINIPELMNIFREVADVQTADMLHLEVPGLRDGKYNIVESEPDWYVKQVMEDFVVRAERIRGGGVDPSEDNFLKITHEARLLGTDARLLEPLAPNNPDGKLNKVVQNVLYEHEKAKTEGIIGCQLIFSDIGTPKGTWENHDLSEKFDVYNYIKEELVKGGIPAEEIAFVHDAKNDAQRATLFKEMRTGKKRIMLGSTEMCGTGVNVQKHIVAMHHIDCPWKPSSIEQREGRGIRRGNENEEIAVYRYVTKGTFDAYSWSLVENKQRFISQVMTSKSISRSCEDIDEATLSYAEIKAVATGNPMIREKMELDNDVQRLKLLKSSYDNQRYSLQDNYMIRFPKLIQAAKEKLSCVRGDIKQRDEVLKQGMAFKVVVGNMTYTERADGGTVMLEAISKCKTGETCAIGKFQCFDLLVEKNFLGTNYLILRGKTDYKMELSTSPVGNMVKLENTFGGIQENEEYLQKKIEQYENDLEASKLEYEKPFVHEEELKEKLARQSEINAMLDLENGQVKDVDLSADNMETDREEADYSVAEPQSSYRTDKEEYHR